MKKREAWWNWECARHLLNRSGFGGRPSEISAFENGGLHSCLKQLFDFQVTPLQRPEWLQEYNEFPRRRFRSLSREERQKFR